MSQDDRDQRGGHRVRKYETQSCDCCPRVRSTRRARRNRTAAENERKAEDNS